MTAPVTTLTADLVIVGAGSAGCVLAEKLSRDPDRRVVLVERGPGHLPGAQDRDLRRLGIHDGAPFAVRHDTDLGWSAPRGSALGGSSVVNGGYFLRWHADDFASWPTGWEVDAVEAAYAELDAPGAAMSVEPVADDELGDIGEAFERYWSQRVDVRGIAERWPVVGLNRVLANRSGMQRRTAAEAFLVPATGRPNLRVVTGTEIDHLEVVGGRTITGVRAQGFEVNAGEVILAAGTLGTAGILLRSGLEVLGGVDHLEAGEHRGLAVSYRRRTPTPAGMVLPSVVHTSDECEIRCYRDDLAAYILGLPSTGPIVEVAAMRRSPVRLQLDGHRVRMAFEEDRSILALMRERAGEVADMLRSSDFASVVEDGSVRIADTVGYSQHAWGTMPMGERVDWLGGVYGTHGLRIVDGSILPGGGHSGPHATIMMMACRIGDLLRAR